MRSQQPAHNLAGIEDERRLVRAFDLALPAASILLDRELPVSHPNRAIPEFLSVNSYDPTPPVPI